MFKKLVKFSIFFGLMLALTSMLSWLAVKQIVTAKASEKAQTLITKAYGYPPPQSSRIRSSPSAAMLIWPSSR